MRIYCTLVISSDTDGHLCETVESLFDAAPTSFIDNQSPERRERIARLRKALPKLAAVEPPRYVWTLSSQDHVESNEFEPHMRWVLAAVAGTGRPLSELQQRACQVYVSCFCEGTGRGGGPTINPDTLKQLADHGVELRFDNYFGEE
jgi:hypothetical protein